VGAGDFQKSRERGSRVLGPLIAKRRMDKRNVPIQVEIFREERGSEGTISYTQCFEARTAGFSVSGRCNWGKGKGEIEKSTRSSL